MRSEPNIQKPTYAQTQQEKNSWYTEFPSLDTN